MQAANRLQQALRSGRPSFGGWQMLPGANLSRVLARTPGLDWICVDTEHGNISDDSMHASVAAIAACGVSPVVRVPEGQHWMLKRALDAGAHAVMIPVIHTVDEARTVVRASKFPPQGTRGLGSPFSMEKFAPADRSAAPLSQTEYLLEANAATLVIVQIETRSALAAVDEIAAIPGIDVLLVGPYDLGNSIGHPVLTAEFDVGLTAAIATILAAAKAHGKKAAIYAASGEQARRYAEQGFDMVNTMNDVVALQQAFGVASSNAAKAG